MSDGEIHDRNPGWRDAALPLLYRATSIYLRNPFAFGKMRVWRKWVLPYLAWRHIFLEAKTIFGQRIRVNLPSGIDLQLYFFGVWEPALTRYFSSILKPGDTFIDIGANIGYYSLLAGNRVGCSGQVFAFEASPSTFKELQGNIERNASRNIVARNVAVTDTRCTLTVFKSNEQVGMTSVIPSRAVRGNACFEETVAGFPLAELLDPKIICGARAIKIDVEGAEWHIIKGMQNLLPKLSPKTEVVMEINSQSARECGGSAEQLIGLFRAAGFEIFEIPNTYSLREYVGRTRFSLRRYDGAPFDQKDFLFRRAKGSA